MNIALTISDRYSLMECLIPMRGNFTEMITCKGVLNDVEISEREMQEAGLINTDIGISWTNNIKKEVELTPQRLGVIKKAVLQLAEAGGLSGLIGTDMVFLLKFSSEEKRKLSTLVDELDKEGKIDNSILQACINIQELTRQL